MDVNVLRWFFGAGRFKFFFVLLFCNSDRCSFKINGEGIGQLLLWECHSLNQAGFVEVNRQWPGSAIHWCHHSDVNLKTRSQRLEKQSSRSRRNEWAVWGERCHGAPAGAAGTHTKLALATALGCLRNRGTARQQNSRDRVESLSLKMFFLHCQLGFGIASCVSLACARSCSAAAWGTTPQWAWSSAGTRDFL